MNKVIHIVWVGDESKRPDNCIDTWRTLNPEWEVRVWGNKEYNEHEWFNKAHMEHMWKYELNGVADMMRWEILYKYAGFAMDADGVCVRPLEDWLFNCEMFACWENEIARPGLLAAGYCYADKPGHPIIAAIIRDIKATTVVHDGDVSRHMAWRTVGPRRLAKTLAKNQHLRSLITIHPSHYFLPEHLSGQKYEGDGPVFARQFWSSTRRENDILYQRQI
jgi:mannosyltransferase OCH1-like enzyme